MPAHGDWLLGPEGLPIAERHPSVVLGAPPDADVGARVIVSVFLGVSKWFGGVLVGRFSLILACRLYKLLVRDQDASSRNTHCMTREDASRRHRKWTRIIFVLWL